MVDPEATRPKPNGAHGVRTDPVASRRRVLFVAYFFPPLGGVSVPRMLSFVRHLPAAGWDPVVLAPRDAAYPLRDVSGLASVPETVSVVRALSPEPQAARRLLRRIGGLIVRPLAGGQRAKAIVADPGGPLDRLPTGAGRPSLSDLRRLVFFPDDQLLWLPFAVQAGQQVAKKERVAAIYSTASPVTAHLVAGVIHRLSGIPWVAEFRDPWVGNPLAPPLPSFHRRLRRRLERWIVGSASQVVFLSTETGLAYERRYPGLAGRWRTVPNGYDREELGEPRARSRAGDPFRLVYTGTLDRPAEAAAFMAGVDLFATRRPDLAARLAIDFVGHSTPEVEVIVASYVASEKVGSMFRFSAFVPRAAVLEYVRDADACLVLLGGERGMSQFLPGKLFDYIGLDVPVLAIVPPGEVRSVLSQLDWGVVGDPTPEGVADALVRLLVGAHRTGTADRDRRFERRRQAEELAAILDIAAGTSGGRRRPTRHDAD